MTKSAVETISRRARVTAAPLTLAEVWHRALTKMLEARTGIRFPSGKYQRDPVGFCRDILGIDPWSRQRDVMNAVRDHDRVACKSGRRTGKSFLAAALALWWYCSWDDARCVLSSKTARQVDTILWRALSMTRARAGRCVDCKASDPDGKIIPRPCPHSAIIEGDIGLLARTGLKSDDFREIFGFTAKEGEAVQGIAGTRLLFIVDEASAVPQAIFDAITGNRAGGGKVLYLGNPTQNEGEFFDAFHDKAKDVGNPESKGYVGLTISSEESPNVVEGREVVPGLATADWIAERAEEWGTDSALYIVHVKGDFATHEEGRIFPVQLIGAMVERWQETEVAGRLYLGCDPAGATGTGDESAFALRRGMKVLELVADRGLDDAGHRARILQLLERHKVPRETPVVVLDAEGEIGAKIARAFRDWIEEEFTVKGKLAPFELVSVRASDKAVRQPAIYGTMRDELTRSLEHWAKSGGAIPEDPKLAGELHAVAWEAIAATGRIKVTRKREIRKAIGRSPDRYDALALAVWEPLSLQEDAPAGAPGAAPGVIASPRTERFDDAEETFDPYAGGAAFRRPR